MTRHQQFNYSKWSIELVHKTDHQIIVGNQILACFLLKLQFENNWKDQTVSILPLKNFHIWIFVQSVLKFKISLKNKSEINHLTNIHLFPHSALCSSVQFRTFLLRIDWAHPKASLRVTIEDVTVKRDSFLTLESPLIWRIHSFWHKELCAT